ncbi:MAG: transcriptional regulator [Rhodobacterales bacterium]|nr:transcriptional regulator [Rhodobacterales bacterium]
MGQINHHLSDQLLIGYAAGALPEAFNLVVATHISLCDECRARLGSFETVGGCLLDSGPAASVASDALVNTLKLIAEGPKEPPKVSRNRAGNVFPTPLHDYAGSDLSAVRWRPMGGGVRQARLATSGAATARLLYIPGGTHIPDHGHRGTEMTLVLQGAFRDETDRFGRGDIEIADQQMQHTPVAEPGAACICLAATDAPLKFNSLIPRIAQPFLRI